MSTGEGVVVRYRPRRACSLLRSSGLRDITSGGRNRKAATRSTLAVVRRLCRRMEGRLRLWGRWQRGLLVGWVRFRKLYPFSPYHGFSLQASRRPLRCRQERNRPPRRRATDGQRGTPVNSSVGAATCSMSSFMSCARPLPTARCHRRTINHLITAMINNHKMRGRGETITERARARARLQTSRRM